MSPRQILFAFLAPLVIPPSLRAAEAGPTLLHALDFTASRADTLATTVLVSPSVFTDYTNTAGRWVKQNRTTWTSGFVPGMFWLLHDRTGDSKWLQRAEAWTDALELDATTADNDQGFQIFYSFGFGYERSGRTNGDYWNVLSTAAANFDTQRFNPTIGCHRTWRNTSANPVTSPQITASTSNPNDPVFEVNIDQMMNLELPLYVGTLSGNTTLVDHAISHADRTWVELVRPGGGTVHVVGFNPDGSVQYLRTHQGWQTDSTWSRGQAWAVYGYAMVYRYTELPRMLERAGICFDFFMQALLAQSTDMIPYSDFDAPVNSQNPRDTSAAAIVASAAVDLYRMTGETKYRDAADGLLLALCAPGYLAEGTNYQSVLRRGSQKWGTPEVGTIFGDYYLLEAILRYDQVIGIEAPADPGSGEMVNISTRGLVSDGADVLIAGFAVDVSPRIFLLRGVGPTLASLGVANPVGDPRLRLYRDSNGEIPLAENDDWGSEGNAAELQAATTAVGAFELTIGSKDAAILIRLDPGIYTLHLINTTAGAPAIGLVEVYSVPETSVP